MAEIGRYTVETNARSVDLQQQVICGYVIQNRSNLSLYSKAVFALFDCCITFKHCISKVHSSGFGPTSLWLRFSTSLGITVYVRQETRQIKDVVGIEKLHYVSI
jgi:hypothetical protein